MLRLLLIHGCQSVCVLSIYRVPKLASLSLSDAPCMFLFILVRSNNTHSPQGPTSTLAYGQWPRFALVLLVHVCQLCDPFSIGEVIPIPTIRQKTDLTVTHVELKTQGELNWSRSTPLSLLPNPQDRGPVTEDLLSSSILRRILACTGRKRHNSIANNQYGNTCSYSYIPDLSFHTPKTLLNLNHNTALSYPKSISSD